METVLSNCHIAMNILQYLENKDIFNFYDFANIDIPIYILKKINIFNEFDKMKNTLNKMEKIIDCSICGGSDFVKLHAPFSLILFSHLLSGSNVKMKYRFKEFTPD